MACSGNCSECSSKDKNNECSIKINKSIKNVIAIMSGKGGVGKSSVTSIIAVKLAKMGYKVGVMDADITGPSILKVFGVNEKAFGSNNRIFPLESNNGIKLISINAFLEDESEPVLWRGPILSNVVKQFWEDVEWEELDYLLIDMPPGTGEIPLTVVQSLPVTGVVIVTTPQDLVEMIVKKSIKMVEKVNIKILGLVENMSYFICDQCNKKHYIFGNSNVESLTKKHSITNFVQLPINMDFSMICDSGNVESVEIDTFDNFVKNIVNG